MKQSNKVLLAIIMIEIIFSFGYNKSISQVTDNDRNVYKTVKIGNQEWMAENLNVEHYRNGDPIPQVQDKEEWAKLTTGAWCYYDNDPTNGKTFGKLYNWYAVNDPRGLAPAGWHIPSDAEWIKLRDYLGGVETAGKKMKSTSDWYADGNGTNSSGFNAFSGGRRNADGDFCDVGVFGQFWSATEDVYGYACAIFLSCYGSGVFHSIYYKEDGFSIRCIRD